MNVEFFLFIEQMCECVNSSKQKKKSYGPCGPVPGIPSLFVPHSWFTEVQDVWDTVSTSLLPVHTVTIMENVNATMKIIFWNEGNLGAL